MKKVENRTFEDGFLMPGWPVYGEFRGQRVIPFAETNGLAMGGGWEAERVSRARFRGADTG